jgi:hypothetical protein
VSLIRASKAGVVKVADFLKLFSPVVISVMRIEVKVNLSKLRNNLGTV